VGILRVLSCALGGVGGSSGGDLMGKQKGRGWYVDSYPWDCHNCCCRVCTGRLCPYKFDWGVYKHRCAKCVRGDFKNRIVLECTFFENKNTLPLRFKIKRRWRRESPVEKKLDAIMDKLGVKLSEDGQNDGK
jgi:hypothetical protein